MTMAKREYNGDPIDMTDLPGESHLSERGGETIAGTSADDLFDESSNLLPDHISEDDLSENQKRAVMAFLTVEDKENADFSELADGRDFSQQSARRGIHKVFRKYRGMDDLGDSYKLAVLILAHHGEDYQSIHKLADEYPVSRTVLGNAKRTYPDLIEEQQPVTESGLEEAVEAYLDSHPSKQEEYGGNGSDTTTTRKRKQIEDKEYPDDFSACQQWFIEAITDNPSYSVGEIAELIPTNDSGERRWSTANYYNNIRDYPALVAELIGEKETVDDVSELADYIQEQIPMSEIEKIGGKSASGNPENNPNGSKQASGNPSDDIEKRLRAVESKVESLRHEVDEIEPSEQPDNQDDLAEIVVQSLSDEQLGRILRGAMQNE